MRAENLIIEEYLPKKLTITEIEAVFLNSDGPEFEQIQNAETEGRALGITMKTLRCAHAQADPEDVKQLVAKIRS